MRRLRRRRGGRRIALWLGLALAACCLAAAVYLLALRDTVVEPIVESAVATSVIGEGSSAVGVSAEGRILAWQPAPEAGTLPALPLSAPPRSGRLAGPVLAQARVLGAAPAALRGCVERSYFGESGVDVMLRSGIELRFGDASQAARKWGAAAAILADPSLTSLDYVDLHSPRRPAVGGSGHSLPAAPEASAGGC